MRFGRKRTSLAVSSALAALFFGVWTQANSGNAEAATTPAGSSESNCVCVNPQTGERQIPVLIRDMKSSHPNFENVNIGSERGIVHDDLGVDGRPVYKGGNGITTTNARDF